MPHCTLEYSGNIIDKPEKKELLTSLNNTLANKGLFSINDIKSRIIVHDDFVMGDGDPARGFVALNLAILSGRDDEMKKMLSDLCLNFLIEHFPVSIEKLKISLTVRITEMDIFSYGRFKNY